MKKKDKTLKVPKSLSSRVHDATIKKIRKVHDLIQDNPYLQAEDLAEMMNSEIYHVYSLVRRLREDFQVGVHSTPKGYILSKDANRHDDCMFVKHLLAKRNSLIMSWTTSYPFIKQRWGHSELKTLSGITTSLNGNTSAITKQSVLLRERISEFA